MLMAPRASRTTVTPTVAQPTRSLRKAVPTATGTKRNIDGSNALTERPAQLALPALLAAPNRLAQHDSVRKRARSFLQVFGSPVRDLEQKLRAIQDEEPGVVAPQGIG